MPIDMNQFHSVFIEESYEHIDNMEHLLLAIDPSQPESEALNSIFRAAHSIKGGSGIFGFEALISVTHVMENLFDKARNGQFSLSREIIDALLRAVDALKKLLGSYKDGTEPDGTLVKQTTDSLQLIIEPAFAAKQELDEEQSCVPHEAATEEIEIEGFGLFEPENNASAEKNDVEKNEDNQKLESENEEKKVSKPSSTAAVKPVLAAPRKAAETTPKTESPEASSIRVDIEKIDSLVNLVGELVITQSMLTVLGDEVVGGVAERLVGALAELKRNTRELQEGIMAIRMLPVSFVFNRFVRVTRDLSSSLGKKVDLEIEGSHTEIDKGMIEKLVDPLTHLVRNSLDHGIEKPEVRKLAGKNEVGKLILRAEQKGGNIIISVIDDGGGLNRQSILDKAREKNIELPENPSDQQVWSLIMAPGFSTATEVTDVSGRGVGMDVVKRNIEALGGRIEITSKQGIGSTILVSLPLTLAILDGMSVAVGDQLYILPLVNIIESVQPLESQLKLVGNQQMLELRDIYWPILRLHQVMQIEPKYHNPAEAILVLIETSKTRFAMLVDELVGQQQVVVKSLEQHYRRVPGIAGATIMGNGSVALILDSESLALQVRDPVFKENK